MTKVAAATSKSAQRLLEFQQNNGYLNDVRLESFGFFLDDYVIYGGNLTFDTVDIYKILLDESIVSLNDQLWRAFIKEFHITKYNTTYFVGFLNEKGYVFGETEPLENYMRLWTIPVDANGNIGVPVDHRNLYGYLKLKAKYDGVYLNVDEVHEAITNANSAADKANQAASDVQSAVDAAKSAADRADEAVISTEKAIESVNSSLNKIDQAVEAVNVVIGESNAATDSANQAIREINSVKEDLSSAVNEKLNEADITLANAIEAADNAVASAVKATDTANQASEAIKGWGNKRQWNNTTEYEKNNIVTYKGSTWQALRKNIGVVPLEGEDWTCLAQKGIDGTGAVSSINGMLPDENGNVELEIPHDAVLKVNGKSPDSTGALKLSAADVGAYSKAETDTAIENVMETLEGLGYNTKSVARLTETQYKDQQNTGHFYVSPDNSGFLPEQETFFGTISKHLSSGSSFTLYELVRLSSGITYTRCVINDGANDLADTGWIEGGGGSGGGGTGTTSVNAIKLSTTTVGQVDWNIPSGTFDPSTDSLLVFHNGVYLPSASWSLKGIAPNHILSIPDNPESLKGKIENNNVSIAIFRNMPFGDTQTIEGTRITPATIGMDRLEQSLQDMINGGGAEIVNNLVTDDPNKTLSAAMGVAIKAMIDAIPTTYFSSSLTLDDETKAATAKAVKLLNDTKLNLTGGTMTGDVIIEKNTAGIIMQGNKSNGVMNTFTVRSASMNTSSITGGEMLVDGALAFRVAGEKNVQFKDDTGSWYRLQDLKNSVVDGKGKVAAAITTKGVTTAADATFDTMATNISNISTGKKYASGTVSSSGSKQFYWANNSGPTNIWYVVVTLPFLPKIIEIVSYGGDSRYTSTYTYNMDYLSAMESVRVTIYNNTSYNTTTYNFKPNIISGSSTNFVIEIPTLSNGTGMPWVAYER